MGGASGTALLARTAAGDMYPPERRARGIALVLFGAVFGAILGPLVFSPLLAGRDLDGDALGVLWLAAGGFMVVAAALVLAVRPDPRRIAQLLASREPHDEPPAAPLRVLLGRPGVVPALLAAQASFAVMVGIMTLTGAVVVDHHHHAGHNVFPIIGAHVIGMYALVLVIGDVIDRIGRTPALAGGLLVMAASASSLLWVESVPALAGALFGLGVGWNLSFVAATAVLADCTEPWERGRLLGFNDFLSGMTGAALALLGGAALTSLGVAALALGGAALVSLPALWILRYGAPRAGVPVAAERGGLTPGYQVAAKAPGRATGGSSRTVGSANACVAEAAGGRGVMRLMVCILLEGGTGLHRGGRCRGGRAPTEVGAASRTRGGCRLRPV